MYIIGDGSRLVAGDPLLSSALATADVIRRGLGAADMRVVPMPIGGSPVEPHGPDDDDAYACSQGEAWVRATHCRAWMDFAGSHAHMCVVLEADAFAHSFARKAVSAAWWSLSQKRTNWDVLFLGLESPLYPTERDPHGDGDIILPPSVEKVTEPETEAALSSETRDESGRKKPSTTFATPPKPPMRQWATCVARCHTGCGTHAYCLSQHGAAVLLREVEKGLWNDRLFNHLAPLVRTKTLMSFAVVPFPVTRRSWPDALMYSPHPHGGTHRTTYICSTLFTPHTMVPTEDARLLLVDGSLPDLEALAQVARALQYQLSLSETFGGFDVTCICVALPSPQTRPSPVLYPFPHIHAADVADLERRRCVRWFRPEPPEVLPADPRLWFNREFVTGLMGALYEFCPDNARPSYMPLHKLLLSREGG